MVFVLDLLKPSVFFVIADNAGELIWVKDIKYQRLDTVRSTDRCW